MLRELSQQVDHPTTIRIVFARGEFREDCFEGSITDVREFDEAHHVGGAVLFEGAIVLKILQTGGDENVVVGMRTAVLEGKGGSTHAFGKGGAERFGGQASILSGGTKAPLGRTLRGGAASNEAMAYGRSNNAALATLVVGAAVAVVGVFLYRRSGRVWQDDVEVARNWIGDQTEGAQGVLERTEKASKELLSSAQSYGHQALGSAKGAYDAVRERTA